ncbi:hypothetical protein ON010_g11555 [Phytophthora cinnamomi]|nr:hypothetical protein ON010_g11555 [Phytophthora cinnamomi]
MRRRLHLRHELQGACDGDDERRDHQRHDLRLPREGDPVAHDRHHRRRGLRARLLAAGPALRPGGRRRGREGRVMPVQPAAAGRAHWQAEPLVPVVVSEGGGARVRAQELGRGAAAVDLRDVLHVGVHAVVAGAHALLLEENALGGASAAHDLAAQAAVVLAGPEAKAAAAVGAVGARRLGHPVRAVAQRRGLHAHGLRRHATKQVARRHARLAGRG